MNTNNYTSLPIDTSDIQLPEELNPLLEAMAKNVHEIWAQERINHRCFVLLVILSLIWGHALHLSAQIREKGYVKEYNEYAEKTPLSEVEIVVENAGTTVSDVSGLFTLQFSTLVPGDTVSLSRISKQGYELFNVDAVKQWRISKTGKPFTIVMCRSDRFKRICDNYYRQSHASYARQLKLDSMELEAARQSGRLKELEYQEQMTQLMLRYEQDLKNIQKIIEERYARIDLSELSDKEKNVTKLIQEGKISEANILYEQMGLDEQLDDFDKDSKELEELQRRIDKIKSRRPNDRDSVFRIFMRSIDALQLEGGMENLMKIAVKLKNRVESDSTYLPAVIAYASFLEEQNNDSDAEKYLKHAERLINERPCDTLIWVLGQLGRVYSHERRYKEAIVYLDKALRMNKFLNINNTKNYIYHKASMLSDLAFSYDWSGNTDGAWECYEEFDNLIVQYTEIDSLEAAKLKNMYELNVAKFLQDHGDYETSDSLYNEYLDRIRNDVGLGLADRNSILSMAELNFSVSLLARGKTDGVEDMLTRWLPYFKQKAEDNPWVDGYMLTSIRMSLSDLYHMTKQYDKYANILNQMQSDLELWLRYNKSGYLPLLIQIQSNAGYRYGQQRKYKDALYILSCAETNMRSGIDNFPSQKDQYLLQAISIFVNFGYVYHRMGNKNEFKRYCLMAEKEHNSIEYVKTDGKFNESILNVYKNLSILFYGEKDFDKAEEYVSKYFKCSTVIPNNVVLYGDDMAYLLELSEDMYIQNGENKKALDCLQKLIEYAKVTGNPKQEALYRLSASQVNLNLGQKKEARKQWIEANNICPQYVEKHGTELKKKLFK